MPEKAEKRDFTRSSGTQPTSRLQEGREYVTMTSSDENRHLSDRINAIHQGGYELQHTSSDERGYVLLVFRKIANQEESASPTGTAAVN